MREFFHYFFGEGTEVEFEYFTLAHILPLIILFVVIFLMYKFKDKLAGYKHESTLRLIFGLVMIITDMSYYWRLTAMPSLGPSVLNDLPITICGWVIIFGAFMIITKNQFLYDRQSCFFAKEQLLIET